MQIRTNRVNCHAHQRCAWARVKSASPSKTPCESLLTRLHPSSTIQKGAQGRRFNWPYYDFLISSFNLTHTRTPTYRPIFTTPSLGPFTPISTNLPLPLLVWSLFDRKRTLFARKRMPMKEEKGENEETHRCEWIENKRKESTMMCKKTTKLLLAWMKQKDSQ